MKKSSLLLLLVATTISVALFILSLNIGSYAFGWNKSKSDYVYVSLAEEGIPGIEFWEPMKYLDDTLRYQVLRGLPHVVIGGFTITDIYKVMKHLEGKNIEWLKFNKPLPITIKDINLAFRYIDKTLIEMRMVTFLQISDILHMPDALENQIKNITLYYPTPVLIGDIQALPCTLEKTPTDIAIIGPPEEFARIKKLLPNLDISFISIKKEKNINPLYDPQCPYISHLYIPLKYINIKKANSQQPIPVKLWLKDTRHNIEKWAQATEKHWKEFRFTGSPTSVLINALLSLVLITLALTLIISIIVGIYLFYLSAYQIESKRLLVLYALGNTSWYLMRWEIITIIIGYIIGIFVGNIFTHTWHFIIPGMLSVVPNINKVNYILNIKPWIMSYIYSLFIPILLASVIHKAIRKQIKRSINQHGFITINFKAITIPLVLFAIVSIFAFSMLSTTLYTGYVNTQLYSFDYMLTSGYIFLTPSDIKFVFSKTPSLTQYIAGGISYDGHEVFITKSLSHLSKWAEVKFHAPIQIVDSYKELTGDIETTISLKQPINLKLNPNNENYGLMLYVSRRLKKAQALGENIKDSIFYARRNIYLIFIMVLLSTILVASILAISIYYVMIIRTPYTAASLLTCGFTPYESFLFIIKRYTTPILYSILGGSILGIVGTIAGFKYLGWNYIPWIFLGIFPVVIFIILFVFMLYIIPKNLNTASITTILKRDI